jgi:hypothetical protein
MPPAIQADAHVFNGVADAADEEIAPQRARQAQARAGPGLVINIVRTLEIQLMPVKVHPQREFAVQKPRLDERKFVVLALGAELNEQPESLAAARERGRVEQVKITLGHFRVTDQRIHRTEAGAEHEVAGVLFLHVHDQILAPGNRRVGRLRPQSTLSK